MLQDFLRITDLDKQALLSVLELAKKIKMGEIRAKTLTDKNIGLYFEKHSTRTRISFEVGIKQLGGHSLILSKQDLQLARGETLSDTAKVLEKYLDAFVARVYEHSTLEQFADVSSIPVINALSNQSHPCQTLADFLTILEQKKSLDGLKLVYLGDGNNVAISLLFASAVLGITFVAASPEAYTVDSEIQQQALSIAQQSGATLSFTTNAKDAVQGADVLYTDTWVSMGDEKEKEAESSVFLPYQINNTLLQQAKDDCIVMHCLPAHRGQEITNNVIDGPQSVVWQQAENRLHAQKALFFQFFPQDENV